MKRARWSITLAALGLVLSPFVMLLAAFVYERGLIGAYEDRLARVANEASSVPASEWAALGAREGVWLRSIHQGVVRDVSGTAERAMSSSPIGEVIETALTRFNAQSTHESLQDIDAQWPILEQQGIDSRASASGRTVMVRVVRPLADGGWLIAERANHRGVRQLLLARRELAKLVLYQLVFAALLVVVLGRWLVTPLERLTGGARAYPARPMADPELLARRDEVGQLARAFTELTWSLEARRQETVDLAADIAHEFKNPLAAIAAASELLSNSSSETTRATVNRTIDQAVERLRATTDSLLSLVRLESTLPSMTREAIALEPWLAGLLDSYRMDPRHAGVTFTLEASSLGTLLLAPDAWASALRNLLDNALVQPMTRREVRLRAAIDGDRLIIDVTDFGPGVSEGNRDKIFRRFFTARPEGVERGTGLGLSIVRAVALSHGGEVTLLAAVDDEGATFRLSVPAATPLPHAVL